MTVPCSGIDAAGVGRQDHALQVAQRQQRLVAVVAVDRLRVAGEVLDRRGHTERARRTRGLQPADVGGAHGGRQRRLLGPGLVRAAPPVVAGKVLHRGEVPVPAGGPQRVRGGGAAGFGRATDPRWRPSRSTAGTTAPATGGRSRAPRPRRRSTGCAAASSGSRTSGSCCTRWPSRSRCCRCRPGRSCPAGCPCRPRAASPCALSTSHVFMQLCVQLGPALAAASAGRAGQRRRRVAGPSARPSRARSSRPAGRSPARGSACRHRATAAVGELAASAKPWVEES